VEQIVESKGAEKDVVPGVRIMRVEVETGDINCLPTVSVMLRMGIRGDGAPRSVVEARIIKKTSSQLRHARCLGNSTCCLA